MTSIYQTTMGNTFEQLHPNIQQRFGFYSSDGIAAIGTGKCSAYGMANASHYHFCS